MFFENELQEKIKKVETIIHNNLNLQKELTQKESEKLFLLGRYIAKNTFSIEPKIYYFTLLDTAKRETANPKSKVIYTFLTVEFQKQCQPLLDDPEELIKNMQLSFI